MTQVTVYIEIEKNSNEKYEFCKDANALVLDRILPHPYYYPFPYGYILNTKAMDGDELDILLLTNEPVKRDTFHNVYIIGVLIMEDEKGMDEKVLCVFEKDYHRIYDIDDVSIDVKESIHWFFTNYKSKTPGRWAKVIGYENKEYAIQLYKKTLLS